MLSPSRCGCVDMISYSNLLIFLIDGKDGPPKIYTVIYPVEQPSCRRCAELKESQLSVPPPSPKLIYLTRLSLQGLSLCVCVWMIYSLLCIVVYSPILFLLELYNVDVIIIFYNGSYFYGDCVKAPLQQCAQEYWLRETRKANGPLVWTA